MLVPNLEELIIEAEAKGEPSCINCGQEMTHHQIVWRSDLCQVGWMCYGKYGVWGLATRTFYESSES